jgi:NADH-quinone oxidoreductase subunit E
MEATARDLDDILDSYQGRQGALIQVLLDAQRALGWIPPEAVQAISRRLCIPLSRVYRAASFYKAISLVPRGRHLVRVCLGTACHVRGSARIMERVEELLGLDREGTSADHRFTLERVNCLGCCALGPVIMVDEDYHGDMTPAKVEGVLERYA